MPLLGLRDDVREAVRRICRNPRTSLFAVGTLVLAIGAATAVFTMAYTALLAPPPYRDGERLVHLHGFRDERRHQGVSGPDVADYLAEPRLFEVAALSSDAAYSWTGQSLPGFDGADVLRGLRVTADYFRVLDQPMAQGRLLGRTGRARRLSSRCRQGRVGFRPADGVAVHRQQL